MSEIKLSHEDIEKMISFIDYTLETAWDRYTDHYIIERNQYTHEQMMRKMDDSAWELREKLQKILIKGE